MNKVIHKKPLWKRVSRKIHLYLGLTIFIPLTLIAMTGSVLGVIALNREISTHVNRSDIFIPSANDVSKIMKHIPKEYTPTLIKMPEKIGGDIIIRTKELSQISISTKSFEVINITRGNTIERTIVIIHHTFFLKENGKMTVGWIGIILFIISFTGLLIWIPKEWSNLKNILYPKFSLQGRALYINLHKSFGIWSLIFLMLASISGASISFAKQINVFLNPNKQHMEEYKNHDGHTRDLSSIASIAIKEVVHRKIASIQIPQKAGDPYKFNMVPIDEIFSRDVVTMIVSQSGEVKKIQTWQNMKTSEKVMKWLSFLHKGNTMGISWRVMQIVLGISLALLSITGFIIWLRKPKKSTK